MEVHKVVSSETAAVLSPAAVGNQAGIFSDWAVKIIEELKKGQAESRRLRDE